MRYKLNKIAPLPHYLKGMVVEDMIAEGTHSEKDTVRADKLAGMVVVDIVEDTLVKGTAVEDTSVEDTLVEGTFAEDTLVEDMPETADMPVEGTFGNMIADTFVSGPVVRTEVATLEKVVEAGVVAKVFVAVVVLLHTKPDQCQFAAQELLLFAPRPLQSPLQQVTSQFRPLLPQMGHAIRSTALSFAFFSTPQLIFVHGQFRRRKRCQSPSPQAKLCLEKDPPKRT